jgi:uncharacterized protein (DUF1697 family)
VTAYVALLRGINVGGRKKVAMSDLRDLVTRLGFEDARTLLQSGNLVFRSDGKAESELERLLEAATEKQLRLQTEFFVRTAAAWKTIIARNPFRHEAEGDPSHLVVMCLRGKPGGTQLSRLRAAISGRESIRTVGSQAYVVYPDGIGNSRLTNALIERTLDTRGTGRNWNTVMKLADLLAR